jgi:hypothetical protein
MPSAKPSPRARERLAARTTPTPIWVGPPAWRLPSGKALAEFALQSGFLAPVLLHEVPFWRRTTGTGWEGRDAAHPAAAEGNPGRCGR